jgi:hypothetical protein
VNWGLYWEFDSCTISSRFIVIKLKISRKISLRSTSIALRILRRISSIAKKELGFWSFEDLVAPNGLAFDYGI